MAKPSAWAATVAHTQLGAAWLWTSRNCRVIADEAGFSAYRGGIFLQPSNALWRADLVGVSWKPHKGSHLLTEGDPVFDLVEVKGHRADWMRERPKDPRSKWLSSEQSRCRLWLLVSATIDDTLLADLPPWWGILRASPEATALEVVRKAPQPGTFDDPSRAAYSLHVLAQRCITRKLPDMRSARDASGMLHVGTLNAALNALRAPGDHWLSTQTTHETATAQSPHNEPTEPSVSGPIYAES